MEGLMLPPNKPGGGNLFHNTPNNIAGGAPPPGSPVGVAGGGGGGSFLGLSTLPVSMGTRSSSTSSAERSLLLGALATHMGVLDARENDAQTIIRKSELWDEITRQFNAQTLAPRSRQQIQTLYKNMKAKARRYEARLAEVAKGVPPPDPDPISEMLLGLLHQQMQHQRRQLQRLAVMDNYSHALTQPTHAPSSDVTLKPVSAHLDTPLLTPDQVMQVSLEEGLATDMEVKNEPQDHSFVASPEDQQKVEEDEDEEVEEGEEETGAEMQEGEDSSMNFYSTFRASRSSHISPHQQGISTTPAGTTALNDQQEHQQQQQEGAQQRPLLFPSSGPNYSMSGGYSSGIPSGSHRTPSPKNPFGLPFQPSPSPHLPHVPSRMPLGSSEGDPNAKRVKLEGLGEIGRLKGCGGGRTARHYNCCCPDLHATLASQAEQEHQMRMKALKEESEAKAKEHTAKMRVLLLEEELLRGRLRVLERKQGGEVDIEAGGGSSGKDNNNL